jgi:hypothetical protein
MSGITSQASPEVVRKGPWLHRLLVYVFTVLFGILAYWLLGFVIDDIGSWPGPSYEEVETRLLDPDLRSRALDLRQEFDDTQRSIVDQQARQQILRDSTANSQTTMNQLLEFQRLSLEKDVTPTPEEQQALADSQQRFLANQTEYQRLNEAIAQLNEQLRDLERQQRALDAELAVARVPVNREFERLQRRHDLTVAAVKLSVLVPMLIVAVVLFLRKRESIYVPLVYALGIAVAVKVMVVMHEYFPARYFKYILIVTFLAIVTRALVALVRMVAHPNRRWLLKHYREAYESFLCPVCTYPIRRGPLKYLFWTRRSIKKLAPAIPAASQPEEPYACPACSTRLYEECETCHGIRPALLPTCEHCGATRAVEPAAS